MSINDDIFPTQEKGIPFLICRIRYLLAEERIRRPVKVLSQTQCQREDQLVIDELGWK